MWTWMANNAEVLNIWVGIGTLLVWLFYAHLLYAGFRRTRQPRILIAQGWGNSIDSVCLINNMSQEAIYIENIFLSLYAGDDVYRIPIADFEDAALEEAASTTNPITRQGPLASDRYINIGTFRALTQQAARFSGLAEDQNKPVASLGLDGLEIMVVAIYGSTGSIIAAQRRFDVTGDNNDHLQPKDVKTQQLCGIRARWRVRGWVRARL